ncbi:MAG: dethiobiotin synthase [Rhodopirellula sp.]|nr:dethiobiotin synthase [Rhodopirellula sp.]|tara:strand:+ start:2038 stop:2796 length:759 start_codon:yes stop_codon:yes gene_type:complete
MILNKISGQKKFPFLISGSDTSVGKTVFSGLLGKYLMGIGLRTYLTKPFCSGASLDIDFLKSASSDGAQAEFNYWYCDEPVSPAAWELATGCKIDFGDIVDRLKRVIARQDCDILLVEGAGGLLAPISGQDSVASLGQQIEARLFIVAPNRVGVINHVLLTVEAALRRGLKVSSVVLMEQEEKDASTVNNAELVRMHMPNTPDFKGVFEFPWLGKDADNPELIPLNVKKAESVLEKVFNEVIKPYFNNDSNN